MRRILLETGFSKRLFARPLRPPEAQATAMRSSFPACLFECHAIFSPSPFDFWLPSSPLGLGTFIAVNPLPGSDTALPAPPRTFVPLRGFYPPRDHHACPIAHREAYLCESPDFPSLPASRAVLLSSLADHRSGPATSRQARCSVNLLEP